MTDIPASRPPDLGRPLDFSTFVLSLGTTTLVQLGDAPDPDSALLLPPDLEAARQTIDALALLEQKTQGNLDAGESRLLSNLLYDLRLRFVQRNRS